MSLAALRERQGSVAERTLQAADRLSSPELLTWLAADPAAAVRAAVAGNAATPPQAGLLLAEDPDTAVRTALARRIGALAPELTAAGRSRLARISEAILSSLVEDVAIEVRVALSEAVAGLPNAPRELILRLARDTELPVAEPVLRLSPLLNEADLLALVAAPPARFTRRVVAARPSLPEPVADAVAASADSPAIAALLANPSAAIREATLDQLVSRAADEPSWQAALVRRPSLPPHATRALAAMLAAHLLEALAARPDLPEGLAETLRMRIDARLDAIAPEVETMREAVRSGDRPALVLQLAAATGFAPGRIEAALGLRSAKLIAALCWRAGWTATLAEEVQVALGIPRAQVVRTNAETSWTLAPSELEWQIGLLEELPG